MSKPNETKITQTTHTLCERDKKHSFVSHFADINPKSLILYMIDSLICVPAARLESLSVLFLFDHGKGMGPH